MKKVKIKVVYMTIDFKSLIKLLIKFTVASTSRVATRDKAKYSQALCCNSASELLKFESVLKMSSITVLISGNRLINLT